MIKVKNEDGFPQSCHETRVFPAMGTWHLPMSALCQKKRPHAPQQNVVIAFILSGAGSKLPCILLGALGVDQFLLVSVSQNLRLDNVGTGTVQRIAREMGRPFEAAA